MTERMTTCPDCGVDPGKPHLKGCDVEICSVCGHQRLGCSCRGHDRLFARWTGLWPGTAESAFLGMDLNEFSKHSATFFIKPKKEV